MTEPELCRCQGKEDSFHNLNVRCAPCEFCGIRIKGIYYNDHIGDCWKEQGMPARLTQSEIDTLKERYQPGDEFSVKVHDSGAAIAYIRGARMFWAGSHTALNEMLDHAQEVISVVRANAEEDFFALLGKRHK